MISLIIAGNGRRGWEVAQYKWSHVHLEEAPVRIIVPASLTKTDLPQDIFVSDEAKDHLQQMRRKYPEREYIFYDQKGPLTQRQIDRLLKLVKNRIGSPKVRDVVIRVDAAFGNSMHRPWLSVHIQRVARKHSQEIFEKNQGAGEDRETKSGRALRRRVSGQDIRFGSSNESDCLQVHQAKERDRILASPDKYA